MTESLDYCVAIRTLGTAGAKYQALLDSLVSQTVKPKHIYVYIAEGYPLPKETVGIETYVRTPKGMITQRSLPFEEIDTEFVLFCDDDLYLPPDFVARMFEGLKQKQGDCIAVNVYNEHLMSCWKKLGIFAHSFITPRKDDGWSVKIKRNASYSYNNHPGADYLLSQSAPGASCLCRMSVYQAIHFDDERWLENMSYTAGDDQLFYYKMHLMGFRVVQYLNSGVIHLDAQAGQRPHHANKMFLQKKNMFVLWYRTVFHLRSNSRWETIKRLTAFSWRCAFGVLTLPVEAVFYKQPCYLFDYFRGLWEGYKYVHSEEYLKIPSFDAYL